MTSRLEDKYLEDKYNCERRGRDYEYEHQREQYELLREQAREKRLRDAWVDAQIKDWQERFSDGGYNVGGDPSGRAIALGVVTLPPPVVYEDEVRQADLDLCAEVEAARDTEGWIGLTRDERRDGWSGSTEIIRAQERIRKKFMTLREWPFCNACGKPRRLRMEYTWRARPERQQKQLTMTAFWSCKELPND